MSDYAEWKRLAEAAPDGWLAPAAYEEDRRYSDEEIRFLDFLQVATPAAVLAMIAENESLRKDAERYRWFRDCGNDWHEVIVIDSHGRIICDEIDSAIDAAMSKEP